MIAAWKGRVLWIETKSRKGELREKQVLTMNMLRRLGHEYHKIKSYIAFDRIINEKPLHRL